MDVMRGETIWIDNVCYRVGPVGKVEYDVNEEFYSHDDVLDDVPDDDDNGDEEGGGGRDDDFKKDLAKYQVEYLSRDRYKGSIQVPSTFYGAIIGKKGSVKSKIESEFNIGLIIPSKEYKEGNPIIIKGSTRESIVRACKRIEVIVATARDKIEFTHFISIPLSSSTSILSSFKQFKNQILSRQIQGLLEKHFQDPSLLHLTIETLVLLDPQERHRAVQLLQDAKDTIIAPILGSKPLTIRVSGLEIMNDDPSAVDVLYAKIHSDELQTISERLIDLFVDSGLMTRRYDRTKLHCTLINTLFALDNEMETVKRKSLNMEPILSEFKDFSFGESILIDEIHISQKRAGKRTKDGYYFSSGFVKLNSCGINK